MSWCSWRAQVGCGSITLIETSQLTDVDLQGVLQANLCKSSRIFNLFNGPA